MRLLTICLVLPLVGCANLTRETVVEESAWQTANVIDLMQTTQIHREPNRYSEIGTMSHFTGPHPSEAQVVFYSTLFGGLHFTATEVLQNQFPTMPWLQRSWQLGSLTWKCSVIGHNHEIGLHWTTHF